MLPRPFLAVLPWLLAALAEAAPLPVVEPLASGGEAAPPVAGRLLGGDGYDGHLFLALGREPEWEGGMAGRASLLAGWNPTFAGFSSRLAVAATYQGLQPSSSQGSHTRLTRAGIGLDEAWLRYSFKAFSWKAGLQAGWFRWRSHADAALAGEYLVRWNDYPGMQARPEGACESLDSLTTVLAGLRFSLDSPARRFRQEALLLLDTTYREPNLSLLWSLNFAPLPGIEAGFAVELDRLLEPEAPRAATPLRNQTYLSKDSLADTSQFVTVDSSGVTRYIIESRSFAARLTIDPMTMITGRSRPDRGGRFYLEAALLGWEKVFLYPDDPISRLHFNAGVNLPAFGILDVFRFQAELWPEPLGIEVYSAGFPNLAPAAGDSTESYASGRAARSHGWSTQLYLSRAVLPWLDVQARVLREKGWRYGGPGILSTSWLGQADRGPWTSFEVRVAARL